MPGRRPTAIPGRSTPYLICFHLSTELIWFAQIQEKGTQEKGTQEKGTQEKGTQEKGTQEKGTDLFLKNSEEREGEADLVMSCAHNLISTQVKDPCV
jgi:hypothetical protein